MMKQFHLGKATDLYDCGTATFGIAKGKVKTAIVFINVASAYEQMR
jgi:hypothetical protein